MKSILSKAKTVAALALAASTLSFGVGLAENASKFVGNITTRGQVRSDFGQYWNQITAENECKWASIEGSRGNRNFSGCKNAFNWAKQNGGYFKFHALLWGSQYPNWLESLSVDDTKKAITDWFDAVKQNFPELDMIDVVNEAIRTGNNQYHSNYPKTKIIQAMGGDNNGDYTFIVKAFKMARERWPDAVLIYNDYNTVQWQKNEGIQLIQTIKKGGAPVDAYGLQAHDMQVSGGGNNGTGGGGTCLNINTLKSAIEEIWNKTETPMFISEYDIASNDDADQKNCYEQQISYFMENEHIAGITIWGYLYGATWTSGGNSGIIRESNGQVTDRPAMTWLKSYLPSHPGNNTTGLLNSTPVDPEPQTPFKGVAFDLSGKIEAEDFDIPGKGRNQDGTNNNSYTASGSCDDNWNTEYRKGTTVSIGEKNGGLVIGCNPTGNSYEYTIKVAEGGTFDLAAMVAADGEGALVFKVGDKVVSDTLKYTGSSWTTFEQVAGSITLEKGEQILTMEVAKGYIDIDWFQISKAGEGPGTDAIAQTVKYDPNGLQDYYVFDMHGANLGVMCAYDFGAAAEILKTSSYVKSSGVYVLRNRFTGEMQKVRVTR
ncbi:MAG: endo-1,4-beta-xylanase [Fibrobacter sp.]|nr:endo-1,4-beta-xylanase [Fibrobacter sp.]